MSAGDDGSDDDVHGPFRNYASPKLLLGLLRSSGLVGIVISMFRVWAADDEALSSSSGRIKAVRDLGLPVDRRSAIAPAEQDRLSSSRHAVVHNKGLMKSSSFSKGRRVS